ncbi:MAG: hypothetical protein ACXAD7_14165, partial [Candidatus Kariarchaeaceae archaeon]
WVEVYPDASISYEYTIRMVSAGSFSIEPTIIDYFDENNTAYEATTNKIEINAYIDELPLDESALWDNVFRYSLIISLIPVAVLLVNRLLWRKE